MYMVVMSIDAVWYKYAHTLEEFQRSVSFLCFVTFLGTSSSVRCSGTCCMKTVFGFVLDRGVILNVQDLSEEPGTEQ